MIWHLQTRASARRDRFRYLNTISSNNWLNNGSKSRHHCQRKLDLSFINRKVRMERFAELMECCKLSQFKYLTHCVPLTLSLSRFFLLSGRVSMCVCFASANSKSISTKWEQTSMPVFLLEVCATRRDETVTRVELLHFSLLSSSARREVPSLYAAFLKRSIHKAGFFNIRSPQDSRFQNWN